MGCGSLGVGGGIQTHQAMTTDPSAIYFLVWMFGVIFIAVPMSSPRGDLRLPRYWWLAALWVCAPFLVLLAKSLTSN